MFVFNLFIPVSVNGSESCFIIEAWLAQVRFVNKTDIKRFFFLINKDNQVVIDSQL